MAKLSLKTKQGKLEEIAKEIAHCKICKQNKVGMPVPGEGGADAKVVFVGEAPGKQEAKSGRPFVGPAGKILRKLIAEAGLKESEVFITSPVHYLPKYVTPTKDDIEHGKKYLFQQLKVIHPEIVVLLGRVAALAILNKNISVAKEHGQMIKERKFTYLITYHPAAPLYSNKVKADLEKDFIRLKKLI